MLSPSALWRLRSNSAERGNSTPMNARPRVQLFCWSQEPYISREEPLFRPEVRWLTVFSCITNERFSDLHENGGEFLAQPKGRWWKALRARLLEAELIVCCPSAWSWPALRPASHAPYCMHRSDLNLSAAADIAQLKPAS